MPHHPDDRRHPHLPLIREAPNPNSRRPNVVPPPAPNRGGRGQFGPRLRDRLQALEDEARRRPPSPLGIDPRLVFRLPLANGATPAFVAEKLASAGIEVLGVEPDGAIIAFRDDASLAQLREAVDTYASGPQEGLNPKTGRPYASTGWDVLEWIEVDRMRAWSRVDRVGRRLAAVVGIDGSAIDPARELSLDVELWHRGPSELALAALNELRQLIQLPGGRPGRLLDQFVGDAVCLARVLASGGLLDRLLEWELVAEIDLPPKPAIDRAAVARETPDNFPVPPRPVESGPRVCVIDSGVASGHPLLRNNFGHADAILAATTSPDDDNGHGTLVGGIAVFGDIRAARAAGRFDSDVWLFSARVLNAANEFDDKRLIVTQMRAAIEAFYQEPYRCRVFNLSLGSDQPWLPDNTRQSRWAECLDVLAREYKVLIVVAAGNHEVGLATQTADAEAVLTNYPGYLFESECGLSEPATAAIAVTVGGIAKHVEPAVRLGSRADDICRAVAGADEPTPTTRIGPGLNNAMKPEFVAHAGNCLFEGYANVRRVPRDADPGIGVMSFGRNHSHSLFGFAVGTSFAAPDVSRIAARVWHQLRLDVGEEPQPNLVRAVLATAANVPEPTRQRVEAAPGGRPVARVCGYGVIDEEFALDSGDRRLTLVRQDRVAVNGFLVYALPIVDEFRNATVEGRTKRVSDTKRIILGLAFDPPVRRRRRQYLGVRMRTALFRGCTLDEIVNAYRDWSPEERDAVEQGEGEIPAALKGARVCQLKPSSNSLKTSTLHRQEWVFTREGQDYGDTYYVVVRCDRNWAPDEEQDFGLAVALVTSEATDLYVRTRGRIEQRVPVRERARL